MDFEEGDVLLFETFREGLYFIPNCVDSLECFSVKCRLMSVLHVFKGSINRLFVVLVGLEQILLREEVEDVRDLSAVV